MLLQMQTHKSFYIHFLNKNEDISNETWEISVPPSKVHSNFQKVLF